MSTHTSTDKGAAQACSASVPGPGLCNNGFRQSASCHGLGFNCPCCGKVSDVVPQCLQDDVPEKHFSLWFDDAGRPLFAKKGEPTHG